jgi:gliding motility-associated-like protein
VVNAWLLSNGGAVAAADCGDPAWSNDFAALTGDSTAVTFAAENACGLTETTSAWIIAGDSPPPVYDTTYTCDAASAGTTTTTVQVGDCLVPLFLTALYVPGDTVLVDSFICEGTPGKDTFHFINRFGCDSLVLRRIISSFEVIIHIDITTCRPDTVGETTIVIPGTPCDTILQINVNVLPPDETFVTDTVCDPAQAGFDIETFLATDGCDSIVTYAHIYVPPPIRELIADSCGPGADYTDTLRVPGLPCDSLILTRYRFHPNVVTERTLPTCDPGMPGSDTLALTSIFGCDSTVITNYLYRPADTTFIGLETCDPTLVISDTLLLQDSGGCDSLVIRTTTYAGTDTIRVQAETCDPAAAGTTITVRPGMPCDTVVETTTILVPTLTRRDTIEICGQGSPVTDTLRFTSSFGCDSLVFRTTIFKRIFAQLEGIFETCAGDDDGAIEVLAVQGGKPPFLASLNGGPFMAGQAGVLPRFDDLAPGLYTIVVRDADGCQDMSDILLTSGQILSVSAGADIFGAPGTIVELSGTASDPFGSWQWTATDPLSCDTCLMTTLGPVTSPQWAILSGITPSGCTDVDSVFIQLRADVKWSVPNVFSPNGDGLNEVFRPAVSDEAAILGRLEIYDRWGGLLFAIRESQPVSTFRGWDGTMNGQPVSPGVYVYVLSFSVPGQDEIRLAGDVTLLR